MKEIVASVDKASTLNPPVSDYVISIIKMLQNVKTKNIRK